jgi:3-hydroxybutyryl-CoA dehydratase
MQIIIGQEASLSKTASEQGVQEFARLTGDMNPVHLDHEFALKTRFGKQIVHGMWVASLISALLGTKLPGPGTIYLSQSLKFLAPVFINETITATVRVIKKREDKPILTLRTTCVNENGQIVLDGEAVVLFEEVS